MRKSNMSIKAGVAVIMLVASTAVAADVATQQADKPWRVHEGRICPVPGKSLLDAIRDNPDVFIDKEVVVSGHVVAERPWDDPNTAAYYYKFQDRFGGWLWLRVQDNEDPMRWGNGAQIRAVVYYPNRQQGGRPVLLFKGMDHRPTSGGDQRVLAAWMLPAILALSGAVLVALIVMVGLLVRQKPNAAYRAQVAAASEAVKAQKDLVETTKIEHEIMLSMSKPSTVVQPTDTDATLKLMPGYFDVLTGTAEGQRLYIYAEETTMGRGSNGACHIGFDPDERSVSRNQAKLRCDTRAGQFHLVNLADPLTKNATIINATEMTMDEDASLEDGDKVRVGAIELAFHKM